MRAWTNAAAWVFGAALLAPASRAQEPPPVRMVRFEQLYGGLESPGAQRARQLSAMPAHQYEVKDGIYRSNIARITLQVPRIGAEKLVDVREAVPLVRADRSPATAHIMFDPDGTPVAIAPDAAVSAVVVTRLRDDRPKIADAILDGLDGGPQQRAQASGRGVEYTRIDTRYGPGLRRLVRNRANTDRFPYTLALLNDGGTTTYGITNYVVVGTDSLVEFSQVFPCGSRGDADCRAEALQAMDRFVDGVKEFRVIATSPAAAPGR